MSARMVSSSLNAMRQKQKSKKDKSRTKTEPEPEPCLTTRPTRVSVVYKKGNGNATRADESAGYTCVVTRIINR